jgi:hypothetical protein
MNPVITSTRYFFNNHLIIKHPSRVMFIMLSLPYTEFHVANSSYEEPHHVKFSILLLHCTSYNSALIFCPTLRYETDINTVFITPNFVPRHPFSPKCLHRTWAHSVKHSAVTGGTFTVTGRGSVWLITHPRQPQCLRASRTTPPLLHTSALIYFGGKHFNPTSSVS